MVVGRVGAVPVVPPPEDIDLTPVSLCITLANALWAEEEPRNRRRQPREEIINAVRGRTISTVCVIRPTTVGQTANTAQDGFAVHHWRRWSIT